MASVTMNDNPNPKRVYLPNSALLGVLVTIESWMLTLYSFLGQQARLKQGVCAALSVLASVFLLTVGRKAMKGRWPVQRGQSIALTGWQAVWVTIFVIAGGLFFYWMFND